MKLTYLRLSRIATMVTRWMLYGVRQNGAWRLLVARSMYTRAITKHSGLQGLYFTILSGK
jgi:hypothetical protein